MLQQHPLSAAFPAMQGMDFNALTQDIAVNGLHLPITLFNGMIIDGWHRYRACLESGVAPQFEDLPDSADPVAFVRSRNLHRRDLTPSQRAAAVVACCEWAKMGANQHRGSQPGCDPQTARQMAEAADVSTETIRQAKAAHAAGLGDQVRDGQLTAKKAAALVRPERPILGETVQLAPQGKDQPSAPTAVGETKTAQQQRKRGLRWESARVLFKAALEHIRDSEDREEAIEMALKLLDEIDVCNL